jgi:hypothetical protein
LKRFAFATAAALISIAGTASAECYTYGGITTCDDGTSYQTYGGTTFGNNTRTGSNWSQTTTGNFTYGSDSDGRSWSQTRTSNGMFGTDADGNAYSCYEDYSGEMVCY